MSIIELFWIFTNVFLNYLLVFHWAVYRKEKKMISHFIKYSSAQLQGDEDLDFWNNFKYFRSQ